MKKSMKLLLYTILLILLAGCCGCTNTSKEISATKRTIVDMVGRKVNIPVHPQKVATMQGPTYELLFMLGAKEQIGLVRNDHKTAYPLALVTNPDLKNYPAITGVGPQIPVNVEEFINRGVDLVLYWNIPQEIEKFNKAGIPVVCIVESALKPTNLDEAIRNTSDKIALLADVLGGNAPARYAEWKKYLDETVRIIHSRTSQLPEEKRPIVFWGNTWNKNILATYTRDSREYEVALCGGKMVSVEKGGQFPETTKEQLLSWSPEVIIVDNHGGSPDKVTEDLKNNPDWSSMPAVKNNRLYRIPTAVIFLDRGSGFPLYYYWLAKQLHPDLFEDVDLVKEMKYYFKTFYDYDLTTAEAEKVLGRMEEIR